MRDLTLRLIFLGALSCAAGAQAQTPADATLTVLAVDPAAEATLARQQSFYVRFEVKNPAPVAVTIHTLYKGELVLNGLGTSGMAMIPAGGGTGVAYFFYWGDTPTRIDEVRLRVSDPKDTRRGKEFAFPVNLAWTPKDAAAPQEFAPWVRAWQQAEKARQRAQYEQYQKRMAETGPSPMVFSLVFLASMCALLAAGFGLPLWGAFKWRGRWRAAALVLGTLPLASLANIIIGVGRDPTSHNLWPFELGLWLAAAGGGMLVLLAVRSALRLKLKGAPPPDAG